MVSSVNDAQLHMRMTFVFKFPQDFKNEVRMWTLTIVADVFTLVATLYEVLPQQTSCCGALEICKIFSPSSWFDCPIISDICEERTRRNRLKRASKRLKVT